VIVDEAHHFPSSFWTNVVDKAKANNVKVIFLTGTPFRSDGTQVIPFEEMGQIDQVLRLQEHFRGSECSVFLELMLLREGLFVLFNNTIFGEKTLTLSRGFWSSYRKRMSPIHFLSDTGQ